MGYRIGSFNMHNIGKTALGNENGRDLKMIARIIKEERFDVVALQEVLSEGMAFLSPDYAKKSIIAELGGNDHWGFEWADAENRSSIIGRFGDRGKSDPRGEGYAFIWNKKRLRLCTTKVMTKYGEVTRTFLPRMCTVNRSDMFRRPYYGRFTAADMPGGTNVEFRLICVHTYYGKNDDNKDRKVRQHEIDVLLKDIYPEIDERRYGSPMDSYTIVLGDYNAELWTVESRNWQEQLKKNRGGKRPAVMMTDDYGVVRSSRYGGYEVKTVQTELTTLKTKQGDNGIETFDTEGYSYNYDHFSYGEKSFKDAKAVPKRITEAVTKYCKVGGNDSYQNSFEKYYKTVSDHLPIVLEIEL